MPNIFPKPADPIKEAKINPLRAMDERHVHLAFDTFPNAQSIFVFFDGIMAVNYAPGTDFDAIFNCVPDWFGGLKARLEPMPAMIWSAANQEGRLRCGVRGLDVTPGTTIHAKEPRQVFARSQTKGGRKRPCSHQTVRQVIYLESAWVISMPGRLERNSD